MNIQFILAFLASCGTLVGGGVVFLHLKEKTLVQVSLILSSVVMVYLSLRELVPEAFILFYKSFTLFQTIAIVGGTFLCGGLVIELLNKLEKGNSYQKLGILSMIALIIHNVPEGIIIFVTANENLELGFKIAMGILLHNIPEGICVASLIYKGTKKRGRALLYTFITGFSEFFGALLSYFFFSAYVNDMTLGFLYAAVAGIMTILALFHLLPMLKHTDEL